MKEVVWIDANRIGMERSKRVPFRDFHFDRIKFFKKMLFVSRYINNIPESG